MVGLRQKRKHRDLTSVPFALCPVLLLAQYLFTIIDTFFDLYYRIRTFRYRIFQLNIDIDRPFILFNEQKNIGNWCFTFSPWHVGVGRVAFWSGLIFEMNTYDPVVKSFDYTVGMQTSSTKIMSCIKVQHISRGVCQKLVKVPARFTWLQVLMKDSIHTMFLSERSQSFGGIIPDFISYTLGPQCLSCIKRIIYLFVRPILRRKFYNVDLYTGIIVHFTKIFILLHRYRDTPFALCLCNFFGGLVKSCFFSIRQYNIAV